MKWRRKTVSYFFDRGQRATDCCAGGTYSDAPKKVKAYPSYPLSHSQRVARCSGRSSLMLSWISAKLCLLQCQFLFISINQLIVHLTLLFIDVNQVIDCCDSSDLNPSPPGPPPEKLSQVPSESPHLIAPARPEQLSCIA